MRKDGLIMGKVINYEHWRSASIRLLLYYMKLTTLRAAWYPHGDQTGTLLSTCHLMIKWLCAQGWSHHREGHQLWTLKKCINSVAALLHETDDPQSSLAPTRWPDWHPVVYMSLNDKVTLCARMVSSWGRLWPGTTIWTLEDGGYRFGCCFITWNWRQFPLRAAWHPHGDQTGTLLSSCHLMIKWLCAQGWSHHREVYNQRRQ